MSTRTTAAPKAVHTVLGIDPGTRYVGIAIVQQGVLKHHQLRTFPGVWSYRKLKKIVLWLDSIMGRYEITAIAIKIPDAFPSSPHYNQLIGTLNVFCRVKRIERCYYQFSEVKARHCSYNNQNTDELMRVMVKKYPELILEYRKEQQNKNVHYYKLFNAVAAAIMK